MAFHIIPSIEESKVAEIKQELENLISSKGGNITFSRTPERTRLSYEIKHNRSSFFGYIQFSMQAPEGAMSEMNEHLRRHTDMLRYLIIKTPSDLQKSKDMIKQIKMRERAERKPKAAPKTPASEEEQKRLDEQLEDIIEKL